MKRLALATVLSAAALAAQAEPFYDQARVRGVEPRYDTVNVPREECSRHWVSERHAVGPQHNPGGLVIGGVAGALLGNQVGKGHGREAATAAGAVVGAIAGDRIAGQDRRQQYEEVPRQVTNCRTVNEVQNRITGYRVNYDYRGQHYTTILRDDPGPNLQVRVSVEPVVGR